MGSETHKITVGIPTLNGPERLDRCLRAIARHTSLERLGARVLVCDDGSRPEELEKNKLVASLHRVPMLMNGARLGVAESWNRLARHGISNWGSEVVALLNDDVEVVPDWLDALAFSVRANPHAGMVGLNAWQGVHSGVFSPPPAPAYNEAVMSHGHGMLASCGFAFAFSAEKFNAVGGFDARYFCFYEEVALGVSFLHKGWPSYMLSYPVVLHQGGATTSDPGNIDAAKRLAESRETFNKIFTNVGHQRRIFADRKWPDCVNWNTGLKNLTD